MKVIIVEVTRAANSFGGVHIGKIGEAYALIRGVVEKAQRDGEFRAEIPAEFAVMAFYGAIEQVLTGWIFGLLAEGDEEYERAKAHVVQTICGGLAASALDSAAMDNDLVKRLAWSGLLAGVGALASIVTTRVAAVVFRRIFGEDPPE